MFYFTCDRSFTALIREGGKGNKEEGGQNRERNMRQKGRDEMEWADKPPPIAKSCVA